MSASTRSIQSSFNRLRQSYQERSLQPLGERIEQLKQLLAGIKQEEDNIFSALKEDLGRCRFETYVTELAIIKEEINLAIKNINTWTKPKRVSTSLIFQPGQSSIRPEPKGVILIIAPWNYPFQLSLVPLVSAIAAGNCVILKPSELAPASAQVIQNLVSKYLNPAFVEVICGDASAAETLLDLAFNHIFFTGSTHIGRLVMQKAAVNLTPVTLELGGKSPCIIDEDCHLELAAKRIMWAKFLNAGQTCIAPDYILINHNIINKFIDLSKNYLNSMFGSNAQKSASYGRIINQAHTERLVSYLGDGEIIYGGDYNIINKYISPTLITNIKPNSSIMQEEIFGPILPIISIKSLAAGLDYINQRPQPLALYLFSQQESSVDYVLKTSSSGSIAINDCVSQAGIINLPFGGVGPSGMGSYHGRFGFETFSHMRAVYKRANILDNPVKYPPYTEQKLKLARALM